MEIFTNDPFTGWKNSEELPRVSLKCGSKRPSSKHESGLPSKLYPQVIHPSPPLIKRWILSNWTTPASSASFPQFEQLRGKLPPDLLSEDDPFHLKAEELESLREEVRELLMGKLLGQEKRHEN